MLNKIISFSLHNRPVILTELKTKDFRVSATNNIKQEALKTFEVSGATTKLEGTAKASVSSNGPITVEGKPIKIG